MIWLMDSDGMYSVVMSKQSVDQIWEVGALYGGLNKGYGK